MTNYENRNSWPGVQKLPGMRISEASNLQVQMPGRSQDEVSPSSTYLQELLPIQDSFKPDHEFFVGIEYF